MITFKSSDHTEGAVWVLALKPGGGGVGVGVFPDMIKGRDEENPPSSLPVWLPTVPPLAIHSLRFQAPS